MPAARAGLVKSAVRWPADFKSAGEMQKKLAARVRVCRLRRKVTTVGAADVAFVGPLDAKREHVLVRHVHLPESPRGYDAQLLYKRERITLVGVAAWGDGQYLGLPIAGSTRSWPRIRSASSG